MKPTELEKIAAAQGIDLQPRQVDFLAGWLLEGKTAKQAAIDAGYSEEYADVITSRLSGNVRLMMRLVFEAKGITPSKIVEKEIEILNSNDLGAKNTALNRIHKIFGSLSDAPAIVVNNNNHQTLELHDEKIIQATSNYEANLKEIYAKRIRSEPHPRARTVRKGKGKQADPGRG